MSDVQVVGQLHHSGLLIGKNKVECRFYSNFIQVGYINSAVKVARECARTSASKSTVTIQGYIMKLSIFSFKKTLGNTSS